MLILVLLGLVFAGRFTTHRIGRLECWLAVDFSQGPPKLIPTSHRSPGGPARHPRMIFQSSRGTGFCTCEISSLDEDVPLFRIFCCKDCYHSTHCCCFLSFVNVTRYKWERVRNVRDLHGGHARKKTGKNMVRWMRSSLDMVISHAVRVEVMEIDASAFVHTA